MDFTPRQARPKGSHLTPDIELRHKGRSSQSHLPLPPVLDRRTRRYRQATNVNCNREVLAW